MSKPVLWLRPGIALMFGWPLRGAAEAWRKFDANAISATAQFDRAPTFNDPAHSSSRGVGAAHRVVTFRAKSIRSREYSFATSRKGRKGRKGRLKRDFSHRSLRSPFSDSYWKRKALFPSRPSRPLREACSFLLHGYG